MERAYRYGNRLGNRCNTVMKVLRSLDLSKHFSTYLIVLIVLLRDLANISSQSTPQPDAITAVRTLWETLIGICASAVRLSLWTLLYHPFTFWSSYCSPLLFPQPISDMIQSSFQSLFEAALLEYENQTGTRLEKHPLAKQLEKCDSIDSITAMLQEQLEAQIFGGYRGDNGKIMKALKSSVNVLHTLSNSTGAIAGMVIDLVSFFVVP